MTGFARSLLLALTPALLTAQTYGCAGANPDDKRFLNEKIAAFLAGGDVSRAR